MSKSMRSPTARLLQSSRLFSLPRPLPTPELAPVTSVGEYRASPSATLPYPTRQAIVTTPSSLHRGDWGLKRPLPAKTTQRTSTPHVRVLAHDNTEHITAFQSAADHTQTRAKFTEINLAFGVQTSAESYKGSEGFKSAYDADVDVIDRSETGADAMRWKKQGPELEQMHQGVFELYLQSQVVPRKLEFQEFLQDWLLRNRIQEEEAALRDQGELAQVSSEQTEEFRNEIVKTFPEQLTRLRNEYVRYRRGSELARAMTEFLDLDVAPAESPQESALTSGKLLGSLKPKNSRKLPTTHPAAGLSYLRTNDFMHNHPLYGPQDSREPVLARVLLPALRTGTKVNTSSNAAAIGIAGIVAEDRTLNSVFDKTTQLDEGDRAYMQAGKMANKIEPDREGGNKYLVVAQSARMDPEGRVIIKVRAASDDSMKVKLGLGEEVRLIKSQKPTVDVPRARPVSTRARISESNDEDSPILQRARQRNAFAAQRRSSSTDWDNFNKE
jgi:hypothetical protein